MNTFFGPKRLVYKHGEKAYKHATDGMPDGEENWLRTSKQEMRKEEYRKNRERIVNDRKVQGPDKLAANSYEVKDTARDKEGLYKILMDEFGMNMHTAFLAVTVLATEADMNVDLIKTGDTVDLSNDAGKLIITVTRGDKEYSTPIDPALGKKKKKAEAVAEVFKDGELPFDVEEVNDHKVILKFKDAAGVAREDYVYGKWKLDSSAVKDNPTPTGFLDYGHNPFGSAPHSGGASQQIFEILAHYGGYSLDMSGPESLENFGVDDKQETIFHMFLSAKLAWKGPERFLAEDGAKMFYEGKEHLKWKFSTPEQKGELLVGIRHTIATVNAVKSNFANKEKAQLDSMLENSEYGDIEIKVFKDNTFETTWNPIQKFAFRRERQLKGFTDWFLVKMEEFEMEVVAELE